MTNEPLLDGSQGFTNSSLQGFRNTEIGDAAAFENRMSVRQAKIEKPGRRESRLGVMKNIFGGSKSGRDVQASMALMSVAKLAGSRTSISSNDQTLSGTRYDPSLPAHFSWKPAPIMVEDEERGDAVQQRHHGQPTLPRRKSAKDPALSWSLPPLFKAFPQAVCHATLPAVSLDAEAVLRINDKKVSLETKSEEDVITVGSRADNDCAQRYKEKNKKNGIRNKAVPTADFAWTTKIYILVTSGYLLQYSSRGSFDRLPEKVLRLGPSSAAFATDAIPGRHWVVQVSSVAETNNSSAAESRSIFSKLSLRITERRAATNLLMVFESVGDMEGWITALRSQIENFGGRRKVSETGKLSTGESKALPTEPTNQRTLVVRDSSRFTNLRGRSSHLSSVARRERECVCRLGEASIRMTSPGMTRKHSLDDLSTTNSMVSQDERQLNSLRESSNRLSYLSSGQRTFITSPGSSPDASPIREKFGDVGHRIHDITRPEVRTRPNAFEIASRRDSMQPAHLFMEDGDFSPHHNGALPQLVTATVINGNGKMSFVEMMMPLPNFSVPRTSTRCYPPVNKLASGEEVSHISARDGEKSPNRMSGMSPVASRSVCRFSPPRDESMTRSRPTQLGCTSPKLPTADHHHRRRWWLISRSRTVNRDIANDSLPEMSSRRQDSIVKLHRSPRRHVSTSALGRLPSRKTVTLPTRRPHIASMLVTNTSAGQEPWDHKMSFLDFVDEGGQQIEWQESSGNWKRVSTGSLLSDGSYISYGIHGSVTSSTRSSNSSATVKWPAKREFGHCLNVEQRSRTPIMARRSMPQMAVSGPPPAPPPTRALPPVPRKVQEGHAFDSAKTTQLGRESHAVL